MMNEINTEKVCRTCISECFNMTNIKDGFIECNGLQVAVATILEMFSIMNVRINN